MTLTLKDVLLTLLVVLTIAVYRWVCVPRHLRHIPRVPILPLLGSYLSGEVEERRVKRILLPFAHKANTDVVLVFTLGEWMVHILDTKIGKQVMDNKAVRKQEQNADMLLWRLTGRQNVFTTEGDIWRRHSRIIHDAIHRTAPMEQFSALARKTLSKMGRGGLIRWSDYTHRFTLDVVGTTVMGYDFEALDNPVVKRYQEVMAAISTPAYIFLPALERWIPRRRIRDMVDSLVEDFRLLLKRKRESPGNDVITYMFDNPDMSEAEFRDNVVVIFMAGHDTTAGALSTVVCFLGQNLAVQEKAREEVLRVMGRDEPQFEHFARMPYLNAVIRESMRVNPSSNVTMPRIADIPVQAGAYLLPPRTPMVLSMCAIHHRNTLWEDPSVFRPERFLGSDIDQDSNWVPFGLGPRQCPARNFSLFEQRVMVSMLLREFRWKLPRESIHRDHIRNSFSSFALNLPYNVDIEFEPLY
ncbi:cytochrome P450 [Dichomitus squalens]|uniref:Cytochrome P450 n=1 Tax=Dichomitus squalens TaxID=114155 RepID=A0A4Q9P1B3_9APHY|nr:cytochrome P450 [Dichomitus squalens]TBU59420.1 cytochrome P450 [Dichomitus squalens]